MTENEMVGCTHRLNGHAFEHTMGAGDGQGGLACCSPWGHKESDTTDDWTELHPGHHLTQLNPLYFSRENL